MSSWLGVYALDIASNILFFQRVEGFMYYLCYQSECTFDLTHPDIVNILEKSRMNNAHNQLTGILLVINNAFVQILEGEKSNVESTFKKIASDKRHHNIERLLEGDIVERSFPSWTMGYKLMSSDDVREMDKYLDISTRTIRNVGDNLTGNEMFMSFLKSFY